MTADHGARGDHRDRSPMREAYRSVAGLLPPVPRFRVQRGVTAARRALRGAAGRVAGSRGALIDPPAPPGAGGRGWRRDAPVVAHVVLGLGESALAEHLDATVCADPAVRPLVITDCDAFALLRERGLLFEYVPPESDWQRHIGDDGYDAFLARRLDRILDAYRPARVEAHPSGRPLPDPG